MIRLCVFDLDGTLSDTLESIALYGNEALRGMRVSGGDSDRPVPVSGRGKGWTC